MLQFRELADVDIPRDWKLVECHEMMGGFGEAETRKATCRTVCRRRSRAGYWRQSPGGIRFKIVVWEAAGLSARNMQSNAIKWIDAQKVFETTARCYL